MGAGLAVAPNISKAGISKSKKEGAARIAVIGLGRGFGHFKRAVDTENVTITALCELDKERLEKAQKYLDQKGLARAAAVIRGWCAHHV